MPRNRQPAASPPEADIAIRSLALTVPSGFHIPTHTHDWAQLIYATSGVMSVQTGAGTWVVPSQRAVWVPADAEHAIDATGVVAMRTLYFRPGMVPSQPDSCVVMNVSPLLRELVLETVRIGQLYETRATEARLAMVLVDQLVRTPEVPLDLHQPKDPRARRVADRVCARPADPASLEDLERGSGASPRTLERLFRREVGMTFGRWRQQVRLLRALHLLAEGAPVTAVALDVGYDSASAFIAMFKRTLGKTPRRYFAVESA